MLNKDKQIFINDLQKCIIQKDINDHKFIHKFENNTNLYYDLREHEIVLVGEVISTIFEKEVFLVVQTTRNELYSISLDCSTIPKELKLLVLTPINKFPFVNWDIAKMV